MNNQALYRSWNEPKKSGGTRLIEAPREDLKAIQRRIADLLQRTSPPDFLFSPVKRRSYVDNALAHLGAREVRLLDVNDYFGSCRAKSVYRFFEHHLRCSPDVAYMLTGLTTRDGRLPQGSPCSPILSFYSCYEMWLAVADLVRAAGCRITIYVDDVTISGETVPETLIWAVKQVLRKHGLTHSRSKERRHINRAAEITGIIVGRGTACVPHRHYRKLLDARTAIVGASDDKEKETAVARARSLEMQIQALATRCP